MRTTIELSDSTYRALREEAASRGLRGLSPIVEEALLGYFASTPQRKRLISAITDAEGAWDDDDVRDLEARRAELWPTWQTDRFSTQTS